MAIEVGDKKLNVEKVEPVDTLHISEKEKNVADKIIKDLEHLTTSGLSLEQSFLKVKQDFKLEETLTYPVEQTLFWQLVSEKDWKQKLNPIPQGYSLVMVDGKQTKFPHYSLAADIDVWEEFIQYVFEKGVNITKDDK